MIETELTEEQQAVVDVPADAMLLVTAGAGAGKTHTMVRRIVRLLTDGEIDTHELLVLSFARSAVRELTERLGRLGAVGRFVRVRTFDAFALDLLMELDGGQDWTTTAFDGRIRAAADLIRDGVARERLADLRHLVVDEAQDLVGVRLELVAALLEQTDCGFTIVGDAAQSIYGFQVVDPSARLDSADACFRLLREEFADDLVELRLNGNFRARTADSRLALPFGEPLRRAAEHHDMQEGRYEGLRDALMETMVLGNLTDPFALDGLADPTCTTAVLCRTNGEALIVSEHLAKAGVPHRVRRKAQDRVAPAWLAALFRAHPGIRLSRDSFDDLARSVMSPTALDTDDVWRQLLRVAGDGGRRNVDMARLRGAVAGRRLPDEVTAQPPADLYVSTFHRAKGLEFDRVVVVDPGPLGNRRGRPEPEESRLLYVAMTRSRDELWRMEPIRDYSVQHCERLKRYERVGRGRRRWWRGGLEMSDLDVASDRPVGADTGADAVALQDVLTGAVRVGDSVELHADAPTADGPVYHVLYDGRRIGRTSGSFATAMFRSLGGNKQYSPSRYPNRITDIRIDAVESVAGSTAAGERAGLGRHGVWLAPRLVGLSRFDWGSNDA